MKSALLGAALVLAILVVFACALVFMWTTVVLVAGSLGPMYGLATLGAWCLVALVGAIFLTEEDA